MEFITYLKKRLGEEVPAIMAEYEGEIAAHDLSGLEVDVKQMTHELGNEVLHHILEAQDDQYPADTCTCSHCGEAAKYQRKRKGMVITLQGRVYYRRAYYLCAGCGHGHYPTDQRLGIQPGQMSAEVIRIAALVGIQEAFGTSRDLLMRTTLLELSANSIRTACQKLGEQVQANEQALQADSQNLERQREHARMTAPKQVCGSLNGFMVLFEDGWHEMKGGTWWTQDEHGQAQDIRYYVDTAPAERFSDLVWATGFERLADQTEELTFVTDGSEWIERIITQHFPHATLIIDWFHACEYLAPVAALAYSDASQREDWLNRVTTDLWEGRITQVIKACRPFVRSHLKPDDDPAQQAIRYFFNPRHRMDYPTYRDHNYPIGSGTMESACKQLGLQRLKISGARWGQDRESACKVAKARATYLSEHWDEIEGTRVA
jgi:hypothetical protein